MLRNSLKCLKSPLGKSSSHSPITYQVLSPNRKSSTSTKSQGHLPGHPTSPFLTSLDESFFDSVRANAATTQASSAADKRPGAGIPTYRLMDATGKLLEGVTDESLDVSLKSEAVRDQGGRGHGRSEGRRRSMSFSAGNWEEHSEPYGR